MYIDIFFQSYVKLPIVRSTASADSVGGRRVLLMTCMQVLLPLKSRFSMRAPSTPRAFSSTCSLKLFL